MRMLLGKKEVEKKHLRKISKEKKSQLQGKLLRRVSLLRIS